MQFSWASLHSSFSRLKVFRKYSQLELRPVFQRKHLQCLFFLMAVLLCELTVITLSSGYLLDSNSALQSFQVLFVAQILVLSSLTHEFYYSISLYLHTFSTQGSLPVISITSWVQATPSSFLLLTDFITHQSGFTTLLADLYLVFIYLFTLISKSSVKILKSLQLVVVEPPDSSTGPFQHYLSSSLQAVPHHFVICLLTSSFSSLPFN